MASHPRIVFSALTWNLFHGRDHPPEEGLHTWRSRILARTERGDRYAQVNTPLRESFVGNLAGWEWDVALLQEAPPRWFDDLCAGCAAQGGLVLTSRNSLGPIRAALAEWNPDLIASGEGGSNMLLVRPPWRLADVDRVTLAERPERRRMILGRMEAPDGSRVALACMHLSVPNTGQGQAEALAAAERARAYAGDDPLLFGGDLNLRPRQHGAAFDLLAKAHGLTAPTGPRAIDHLLARDVETVEPPTALPGEERDVEGPDGLRVRLSDHAPVAASFGMR
jgi:endonuclease/exonuclease/phosphatase family metal-dependent hydrolase